jgi:hypothetical protein
LRRRVEACASARQLSTTHVIRSHLVEYLAAAGINGIDPGIAAHSCRGAGRHRPETSVSDPVLVKTAVSPAFASAVHDVAAQRGETVSGLIRDFLAGYASRAPRDLEAAAPPPPRRRYVLHISPRLHAAVSAAAAAEGITAAMYARDAVLSPTRRAAEHPFGSGSGDRHVGIILPAEAAEALEARVAAEGGSVSMLIRQRLIARLMRDGERGGNRAAPVH